MDLKKIEQSELLAAIQTIAEPYREICILYCVNGLSAKDIGDQLKIKRWRVYNSIAKGEWQIKKHFNASEYQQVKQILYGTPQNNPSTSLTAARQAQGEN